MGFDTSTVTQDCDNMDGYFGITTHRLIPVLQYGRVGCYIPPSDLETLTYIDKAWIACPTGAHPILAGDLNINLHALCTEQEEMIANQVDSMNLVDMSRHFCQRLGKRLRGSWTWQMRRGGRWISSQCDYFLGRETGRRRFWRISIWMPCYYSDHRPLVAVIYAGGGGGNKSETNGGCSNFTSPSPTAPINS